MEPPARLAQAMLHADEIIIHKMGAIILQGFGRYRMYYKEGIDKLGLDVHVFKVGTYKSATEPYLRDDMSEYAKEAVRSNPSRSASSVTASTFPSP